MPANKQWELGMPADIQRQANMLADMQQKASMPARQPRRLGKVGVTMKRIYVQEQWCLGCHLCEYYCAFANSGASDMVKALKNVVINPRIKVEEGQGINFAVSCRHCDAPLCVQSCLTGALAVRDGVITVDQDRCVGCYTCILVCPYGAVVPASDGVIQKCELCLRHTGGQPMCVLGCPNQAIVFEER